MTPQPNLAAAQPDWLLRQAIDFYRRSDGSHRTPGSRASNRRKFVELVKQLLPLIGQERLLAAFGAGNRFPQDDTAEARAIIAMMASECDSSPAVTDEATRHAAAKQAADTAAANKLLAASLASIVDALRLLNPQIAAGATK